MWEASQQSSYEQLPASEHTATRNHAPVIHPDDDSTLSLRFPLSSQTHSHDIDPDDALSLDDPLDEKYQDQINVEEVWSTRKTPAKWRTLARRLNTWVRARRYKEEAYVIEEDQESVPMQRAEFDEKSRESRSIISKLVWPLPSWSHGFFGLKQPDRSRYSTDYLNGLRGMAAIIMFFDAYLRLSVDDLVDRPFVDRKTSHILQLPFLRTLTAGWAMIPIYFVISGFVLSLDCVVAIRDQEHRVVHRKIASMMVRRGIRLFLPTIIASSMMLAAIVFGFVGPPKGNKWSIGSELKEYWNYLRVFLFGRVWDWQDDGVWIVYLDPGRWHIKYAPQLWTVPTAFSCSIVVFILLLTVSRCKAWVRLTIEIVFMLYAFTESRWDAATFVAGTLLAEIYVSTDRLPDADTTSDPRPRSSTRQQAALWTAFFFGWFLTGLPSIDTGTAPCYAWLTTYWEQEPLFQLRFWLGIASILVVGSVMGLPLLQRLFGTSLLRYLGKISFSLYLLQALLNATLRVLVWNVFGVVKAVQGQVEAGHEDESAPQTKATHFITISWTLATIFYLALALWAADIFCRSVDRPIVRFAKWLQFKTSCI